MDLAIITDGVHGNLHLDSRSFFWDGSRAVCVCVLRFVQKTDRELVIWECTPKCLCVCVISFCSDSLRVNRNNINPPPFAPPALVFSSLLITRFLFNN